MTEDAAFPYEVTCPVCGANVLSLDPATGAVHIQLVPEADGPGYAVIRSLQLQTVIHRCDKSVVTDFIE